MLREFKLPDVGEGLTEADIVAWHVKPGDQVEDGQIIVEIETAKAVVELPSPWDGTVARLLAAEGQTVDVGTPIIAVEVSGAAPGESAVAGQADSAERSVVPAPAPADAPPAGRSPAAETPPDQPERQPVLVGYGVRASSTTRRARRMSATRPEMAEMPTGSPVPTDPVEAPAEPEAPPAAPAAAAEPAVAAEPAPATRALAKPPVRRLAKDLGINLA